MMVKVFLGVAVLSATLTFAEQSVSFKMLLDAMEKSSPKLEQQRLQTKIAQQNLRTAEAAYLPTLSLGGTSEYSHKFYDSYTPSSVGSDSLTQTSQYQNSSTISLTYDLFRFGATYLGVKAAKEQIKGSKAGECVNLKEQIDSLLEAYVKVRIATAKLAYYQQMQKLYQDSYIMAKRLNEAGELAQTEVITYAQNIADQLVLTAQIHEEKESMLAHLSYLTGVKLDATSTLEPLTLGVSSSSKITFEESSRAKQAYASISQKEAQLQAEKTRYLPVFSLYGKYDLYGSDEDQFNRSMHDVERNGYRVGLSFSWVIFDGFAREAAVETRLLELQQAKVGLVEAKRMYEKEQYLLEAQAREREQRLKSAKKSEASSQNVSQMIETLHENGEKDKLSSLKAQIQYYQAAIASHEAEELLSLSQTKEILFAKKEYECVAH
ncbi:TolC family protein [Sulfurospirillum deleyianum]|uniref:Outer membrane efflux protein n=1 Tax=Sulfurospirillum deleyianum (strain ATCC 51133 / DSM 6946 / 5175) TaxID=525898 RepID=D1B1P4_SULD5|nr:TolC family protein [Sulfurospirillum deleyianum]ACZ12014.1 outer membrane efflux protein [Sulfurospirillum deleyianum DSM 6946]